jgi:hypothetical protein
MYFSATPCVSQADPISRLPSINQALGAHDGMDPVHCVVTKSRHDYSALGTDLVILSG